ncbi:MAG TPA: hypothetical protein VKE95_06480 [Burkholderiales bacterium]|nr:hypothetical protein [Burkholderiales bacterium]
MVTRRFAILATLLLPTVLHAQVGPVNDNHGKEWRQPVDTAGLSWKQVARACPGDGVSPCAGVAGGPDFPGPDLTGWVWATQSQVTELFSYYTPDILTSPSVQGQQYFFSASAFLGAFRPSFSMFLTYQTAQRVDGWTASTDSAGFPVSAGVGAGTTSVSIGGSFGLEPVGDPAEVSSGRGVFLWRSTGLVNQAVIANDDTGQVPSPAGGTAVANVLANDWNAGVPATTAIVTLSQESSTSPGVTLDPADGSVRVASGTQATTHTLVYKICDVANPVNCDGAAVRVTVPPYVVNAVNDQGTASPSTGGVAVASVLANDVLGSGLATTANVTLTQQSSTDPGVTLDPATGSVNVAQGTPTGTQTLLYQMCETANPTNCDQATVTVNVVPYVVGAVNDQARVSSKTPGTAIASVLANDSLGGARATPANVQLSLVSLSPPNSDIKLDLSSGSVSVLRKTTSGTYTLVYQICEIASPSNCAQARVTLDLSGK